MQKMFYKVSIHSLSLSVITTSASLSLPSIMPNGNDILIIAMLRVSFSSDMLSSFIGIANEVQLVPAGNVTRYCVLVPISP